MDEMPKKRRKSRAQHVVEQARRNNAKQGNVHELLATRVERGFDNGSPTLTAIFARKGGGEPDRVNLNFLLKFPELTDNFANAFIKWGRKQKNVTRSGMASQLSASWFSYLYETGRATISLSQIDEQVMTGFKVWQEQHVKSNGEPLNPHTIAIHRSKLRTLLRHIPEARDLSYMVPTSPRGASRKQNPTKVLHFDELLKVMVAVEKEIVAIRQRVDEGRRLLEIGRKLLSQGVKLQPNPRDNLKAHSEENIALALAMLESKYEGVIPNASVQGANDSLLLRSIAAAIGVEKARGYFYFNARDLVPLVLSITIATVFNPHTVLTLCWKNIDRNVDRLSNGRKAVKFDIREDDAESDDDSSESKLVKIVGVKNRARRQFVRLLDPSASGGEQVSLNFVLDLLVEMTARIRPHVVDIERFGDRVFIFVPLRGPLVARGFVLDLIHQDITWPHALRNFIKDNELPSFTLKNIRASVLDYTQIKNRGDLEAARQVGNHSSRTITWTHYTSDLVKRLLKESVGETMLVRERWLQSEGKIDPRINKEWTGKGCATPGWTCLDPFDSPRPNQIKGSLCTAYGECPVCPLAAASRLLKYSRASEPAQRRQAHFSQQLSVCWKSARKPACFQPYSTVF